MPTVPVVVGLEAVNTGAAAAGLIAIEIDAVVTVPTAFVADTVTVAVPALVGVPASTPVAAFRLSPLGRVPDATANVMAVGYPEAVNVYPAYAVPTVPVTGGLDAVNTGAAAAGLTVIDVAEVVTVPVAFVALTVKPAVPGAVGVPASTPVVVFRLSPLGWAPEATANVMAVG